jgi:hypothetical protein
MSAGCSRRRWLAGAAAAMGLGAAAPLRAGTRIEVRAVPPFHALHWQAAGELRIEQTGREHLSVEAEPTVLARLVTEVRDGRLAIRFAPGRVETPHPIRIRVELKALEALDADGAGALRIGPLATTALSLRLGGSDTLRLTRLVARTLDVQLDGSGDVAIDGGQVDRQQVRITGAADYRAPQLASREARVSIEGTGEVRLAASGRLDARIDGAGELLYRGTPAVVQAVGGSGSVRRLGA